MVESRHAWWEGIMDPWELLARRREFPLDGENTTLSFAIRWCGAITVRGRLGPVRGVVRVPAGDLMRATLEAEVDAASIRTGISLRDRHLRGPSFLDAARHPRIRLCAEGLSLHETCAVTTAMITLRGVTGFEQVRCVLAEPELGDSSVALRLIALATIRRRRYSVGAPRGLGRLHPLYMIIGETVSIRAEVRVPVA